jgi:hypothetical protein
MSAPGMKPSSPAPKPPPKPPSNEEKKFDAQMAHLRREMVCNKLMTTFFFFPRWCCFELMQMK